MKKRKKMRLSENDIKVVLKHRGLENNPFHYSVDSQSTYRLNLTREEEDLVAADRAQRALENGYGLSEIVDEALQYIYKDYDITVSLRNKITGNVTTINTRRE